MNIDDIDFSNLPTIDECRHDWYKAIEEINEFIEMKNDFLDILSEDE